MTTTVASTSSIPLSDTNPSPAKANAISKTSSTVPSNNKPPIVASSSVEGEATQSAAAKANAVHFATWARVIEPQRAHLQFTMQQALGHKTMPAQAFYFLIK